MTDADADWDADADRRPSRDGTDVRRFWAWPVRRRTRADLGRWPFRVGICTALAVAVGTASLVERDALSPPDWLVILLVTAAVLPWLVDLLVIEMPPWLFAAAVIVPVAIQHDPTQFDPLPLLLAVLALDMGLWLGFTASAPVVVASTAVVLWPMPAGSDDPGWLVRPLMSIAGAWLIGLAFHAQLRRIAKLRAELDRANRQLAAIRQDSHPHLGT